MLFDHRALSLRYRELTAPTDMFLSPRTLKMRALSAEYLERKTDQASLRDLLSVLSRLTSEIVLNDNVFSVKVSSPEWLAKLPHRYGVKGGAAREIAFEALGIRSAHVPRDIDIIRLGTRATAEDTLVAQQWMPADVEGGHGVELIKNLPNYFAKRDLTVNEIMVLKDSLSCTAIALLDLVGLTLRPCKYKMGSLHRTVTLQGSLALKMIRLWCSGLLRGEPWRIVGLPDVVSFTEFDLALQLHKAFEEGEVCAREFTKRCGDLGLLYPLPDDIGLEELVGELEYIDIRGWVRKLSPG